MSVKVVLFDLDGTLSDSAPGILSSLRAAFAEHELPWLDPQTALSLVGPPLPEGLEPLIGADRVWPVIESFRKHYATAMFTATPFDGVGALLDALRGANLRLAVATSKREDYAVPIVEHLGFADYFETIGGDEPDRSLTRKALVIGKVLARLDRPDPSTVLMIGDRMHDVVGAREHGIGTIGAGWGYARAGELESARPLAICANPADVATELGLDSDALAG